MRLNGQGAEIDHADRRAVNAWCMYDWANSAFSATIMAAVFPIYYGAVAARGLPPVLATSYWGYTNTIAMLLVSLMAPILGAIADHSGARKRFLRYFAGFGIFFTALMVFIGAGDWKIASLLYILALFGWSCANIFYDSLLPHVAETDRIDQVSSRGYALGYLGGGLLLGINIIMIKPEIVGITGCHGLQNVEWGARFSFLSVALWWTIFSLPLLRYVNEPPAALRAGESRNPLRAGLQRLKYTLKDIRRYSELFKFLMAFWFYNDGIASIIIMAVLFGREIGIGQEHLLGAILMVQFVGMPFAIAFGWLASRIGAKRSIYLSLFIYALIAVGGYFMQSPLHFWILAFFVAMVQGGSQALSRSLFGKMVPKGRTAEFFGFYDVSSKFASIIGPSLFATVGLLTGSSRNGILSLLLLFIAGGIILTLVDEDKGIQTAEVENKAAMRNCEAK
ncbi:MAG: MFS transporter [Syntrophales bacterium]|nr:MFS transporter [Syntrophales bacterium]